MSCNHCVCLPWTYNFIPLSQPRYHDPNYDESVPRYNYSTEPQLKLLIETQYHDPSRYHDNVNTCVDDFGTHDDPISGSLGLSDIQKSDYDNDYNEWFTDA